VLAPDGRATLLLDGGGRPALAGAAAAGLDLDGRREVSLAGRRPAIVTLVPRAAR
jgi:hypothetical protein